MMRERGVRRSFNHNQLFLTRPYISQPTCTHRCPYWLYLWWWWWWECNDDNRNNGGNNDDVHIDESIMIMVTMITCAAWYPQLLPSYSPAALFCPEPDVVLQFILLFFLSFTVLFALFAFSCFFVCIFEVFSSCFFFFFLFLSHLDQQSLHKVLGGHLDMAWPLQFARENLLVDPKRVVVVERWIACKFFQFIKTNLFVSSCRVNTKTEVYDPKRDNFVVKAHRLTSRKWGSQVPTSLLPCCDPVEGNIVQKYPTNVQF